MLHVTDLSNPTIHNWNIPEPKKDVPIPVLQKV